MDMKDVLAKIDTALGPKTRTLSTKADAEAYVVSELAKAKGETEEDDKEEGAKKAKKRLEALRPVVDTIAKTSWEGMSNPITIPVTDEPDATDPATSVEQSTPAAGNSGTAGDGTSFAAKGTPQDFNAANSATPGKGGGGVPPIGNTAADGQSYAASGGAQGFGEAMSKSIDDLQKAVAEMTGTAIPAPVAKSAPVAEFEWPRDVAGSEEVIGKEKVAKNVAATETWGSDGAKAV